MVRAAGIEAYAMRVADRSERVLLPGWLNSGQMTDEIVMVPVNGGVRMFDPGTPFCDFGRLAWEHTATAGMRQTAAKPVLGMVPDDNPRLNERVRAAKLTMDAKGELTGTVELTYTGSMAQKWRRKALTDGEDALEDALKKDAVAGMPDTVTLTDLKVGHAKDFDQPFGVTFTARGRVGSAGGHRVLLPVDLFEAKSESLLVGAQRTTPLMFEFPYMTEDSLRLTLPAGAEVEATPAAANFQTAMTGFDLEVEKNAAGLVVESRQVLSKSQAPLTAYAGLLDFYGKVSAANAQTVVVKVGEN